MTTYGSETLFLIASYVVLSAVAATLVNICIIWHLSGQDSSQVDFHSDISHFDLLTGDSFVSSSDIRIQFQEFSVLPYPQHGLEDASIYSSLYLLMYLVLCQDASNETDSQALGVSCF